MVKKSIIHTPDQLSQTSRYNGKWRDERGVEVIQRVPSLTSIRIHLVKLTIWHAVTNRNFVDRVRPLFHPPIRQDTLFLN